MTTYRPSDNVIGNNAFHQNRLDPEHLAQVDAHIRERLLLATPAGHRIQANVACLVVHALGCGVDRTVRNAARRNAQRPDDAALGLPDARNRTRIDQNVAGSGAAEVNLGALFIGAGNLIAVAWSAGVIADRTLASQIAKVPDSIRLAPDNVVAGCGKSKKGFRMRILWTQEESNVFFLDICTNSIKSQSVSYCFSVSPANLNVFWQPKKKLDWNFVSKYCPYSAPGVGCGIPTKDGTGSARCEISILSSIDDRNISHIFSKFINVSALGWAIA